MGLKKQNTKEHAKMKKGKKRITNKITNRNLNVAICVTVHHFHLLLGINPISTPPPPMFCLFPKRSALLFISHTSKSTNIKKKSTNKQKKRNNINSNSNNNPCNNLSKTKKKVHFELVCNINKLTTIIINNDILHLNC